MTPYHAQLISQLDQMNAALADVFAHLDEEQLCIVRRINENVEAAGAKVDHPDARLAFRAASMAISRAMTEREVAKEIADAE